LLKARPGVAGDLWLSVDNDNVNYQSGRRTPEEGLYHSVDGGATWTKVTTVGRAWLFCFGKPPRDGAAPAMYLYGRTKGAMADAIYRSDDLGKAWIGITDPANPIGDVPLAMEGSRQTAGVVFIGTSGRGVFYGAPTASSSIARTDR
jgi:hypothetical protein